jgi:hypothetical protein
MASSLRTLRLTSFIAKLVARDDLQLATSLFHSLPHG